MPDTGANKDLARLVVSTANRLRLVQADFADHPESVRRSYLAEELERALSAVPLSQRQDFLEQLKEQFPAWDARVEVSPAPPAQVQAPTDQRELTDPSFLVSRLIELLPSLNAQQRQVLVDRLAAAGLVPLARPDWPAQSAQALRTRVQAGPDDPLDPARVLELLTLLVEFTASIDQLVWTTWKTIAPRSTIRRPAGMLRDFARFASGDPDVPRGQVSQDLDRLRQIIAALVSAISQAGRQFAHSWATRFVPSEIEALANMERGGMLVSREVKCWRKYVELSSGRDETAIESEIMQAIADYAESLMKGLGR